MGGYVDSRGYLIRGGPGTGKTTVGMHFLVDGVKKGEKCLYITLGESARDLTENSEQIGLSVDGIEFLDLSPDSKFFSGSRTYDLFSAAEVERDPMTKKIVECVTSLRPRRVFLDSTSHLRYLSIDAHQFRKQLVSFIRFLLELDCIVLFTSESTTMMPDDDVMYLSDAVLSLTLEGSLRTLEICKFRGSDYRMGKHTLKLTAKGAVVFPRLVPSEHIMPFDPVHIHSGIEEIDRLLNGGLEKGTVTLFSGPAGVGKTTLALQFAKEAAKNGTKVSMLSFEESIDSIIHRAESVQIPLKEMVKSRNLNIITIEPLLYSADQISSIIREEVEVNGVQMLILDGITGYRLSVEGDIQTQLRSVVKYLTNMGVTVIAINETENITGDFRATEIGISYMADNIVFIRYLELKGELRKAIGVLKKRLGDFERNIREFAITSSGIKLGQPLTNLRGILQGVPEWKQEISSHELIGNK
ncbi:MAG: AAA family ATPase [Proteobacteria bacterium]|nr:MAG: AAA family ATPase [Pseudomonadota bacterium]